MRSGIAQSRSTHGVKQMTQLGVFVLEENAVIREGLRLILERATDLTVVGEAENGEEACKIAPKVRPDVIIISISSSVANDIRTIERINLDLPRVLHHCS